MESNLVIKQFQEYNITIYGTVEKPLFKAKDIGDLLGIKDINSSIKDFNNKQKGSDSIRTLGGQQEFIMLTEQGLYKVLMKSRKPIAEKFQDWVCEVIEEVRKTGKYESQKYIENKAKSDLLVEQSNNKSINYIGVVEETEERQIVKYGRTNFIKDTLSRHQVTYGEDFYFLHTVECDRNHDLEKLIQSHTNLKSRHIKTYNGTPRQELLKLDKDFTSKDLINLIGDLKETLNNNNELRRLEIESRTKQIEAQEQTKQEQEQTKQAQERTKQLQLELELKKLEMSNNIPNVQEPTPILPKKEKYASIPKEDILLDQFIDKFTKYSDNLKDYISIDDLYSEFDKWNTSKNTPIPRKKFGSMLQKHQSLKVSRVNTNVKSENSKRYLRVIAVTNIIKK